MTTIRNRIERLEREMRFRRWVRFRRFLESLSPDEVMEFAMTGQRPQRPGPAPGMSPIDDMEREQLLKMWKEDEREFAGRNCAELAYFALNGYWVGAGVQDRVPEGAEATMTIRSQPSEG